uniref:Septenin 1j n=1 Tax=Osteopilus septentrionalis TaxID=317373 RepID=SEP1J_OSTSE|nr:RecName: Full=Septenin 1j [Osteopilus septentrionalis]
TDAVADGEHAISGVVDS